MSDSRVNKQAQVNFHPTSSNVVSALNGSHWDGSTLKRPIFFFPLSDAAQAGALVVISDQSGNANNGILANATQSMSYAHDDTPWGSRYRKGIHKTSLMLNRLGRRGTAGALAEYKDSSVDGVENSKTTHFRMPASSCKMTSSKGNVVSTTFQRVFAEQYTFSCWFKPDSKLFEKEEQAGRPHMLALFDLSGSAKLMYNVEAGTLNYENDADAGADLDYRASTIKRNLFKPNKWHHVTISRDRKKTATDEGGSYRKPRIYLNGKRLELTGTTAKRVTGQGVHHDNAPPLTIYLGVHANPHFAEVETSYTRNYKNFVGKVCHFIGWNTQLSDRDIYTIYGASLGAYERKSGNLDIIPLLERQFIKDNKTGSYPTIQRSGIDNRHGSYRSFYDDRNTVVFKKHADIFPGEINKIKKGQVLEKNLMGWWRFQELLNTASNPTLWEGRYKIGSTLYNDVSSKFVKHSVYHGVSGAHKQARPGISTQRVIDSGPHALSGTLVGDATFTSDNISLNGVNITTSSKGPFPKPRESDVKLMSPDQLVRWGGQRALYLPQTGSKASFVQFTDQNKPKLRLIRDLRTGKKRDRPWTMSMWFKVESYSERIPGARQFESEGSSTDVPRRDFQGIFRIENTVSGTLSRARIAQDNKTGKWQIKWWVYGLEDTNHQVATASVETNYLYENAYYVKQTPTASLPNRGMPEGWHHLAFVYRGGKSYQSVRHWQGNVRSMYLWRNQQLVRNPEPKVSGGRMQIWLNGKQLVTSASLTNIENFERIAEPGAKIAGGKKIVFGHYHTPGARISANSSITGSFSGSIAEVALFKKALKRPGLNRIINNGLFIPEVNVTDYPMMLDRDHPQMDRMPVTDIKTFGSTKPGISDTRITFTKGDDLEPFDDRKTLVATGTNLIGTPAHISPGLEAPLGSKASFTVNISPKNDMVLMKYMHTGPSYATSVSSWEGGKNLQARSWNIGRSTLRALARKQALTNTEKSGSAGSVMTNWPRVGDSDLEGLDGFVRKGGPIEIGDYTGFVYYNFEDGKWEQMGLYDPASGERIHFDYSTTAGYRGESSNALLSSASFPQQFKPGVWTRTSGDKNRQVSFVTTGRPTMTQLAPYSNKYHATSSQVIRVSDYVKQPFLLERIRVELPVQAYKTFGGDDLKSFTNLQFPGGGAGSYSNPVTAVGRVMHRQVACEDNVVFFIYRQTRGKSPKLRPPRPKHDSNNPHPGTIYNSSHIRDYTHPLVVSGTQRYLVCSGVATFYNGERHAIDTLADMANTDNGGTTATYTGSNLPMSYEPLHTPAWKYNWDHKLTLTDAEYASQVASGTQHAAFTGSIIMDIVPAVQGRLSLGNYIVFGGAQNFARGAVSAGSNKVDGGPNSKSYSGGHTNFREFSTIYGFWPGGTGWKNVFPRKATGRMDNLGFGGQGSYLGGRTGAGTVGSGVKTADFIQNFIDNTGNQYMLPNVSADDERTIFRTGRPVDVISGGGPTFLKSGSDDPTQQPHPYLLMPEDELIFGLDYLPGIVNYAYAANELSGSYVKLLSTGSAQVTFYGSFFKEGKAYSPSLNQNLTSNAVHEVIGNEPVVDEFMIAPREQYSGSYIDNLMRGGPPGIRGMAGGYHSGSFSRVLSGNMQSKLRWRQSIVGEDVFKVMSEAVLIQLTGSRYSSRLSSGSQVIQHGLTPHGGPVWGTKHGQGRRDDGDTAGYSGRLRYKQTYISGLAEGDGNSSHNSGTYYYSLLNFQPNGTTRGGWTFTNNTQHMTKPLPASLLRGVRLTTHNERYFDSLMPHLGQYAKSHKGAVVMGRNHNDTRGTRRPAISLPGQTSITSTGSFIEYSGDGAASAYAGRLRNPSGLNEDTSTFLTPVFGNFAIFTDAPVGANSAFPPHTHKGHGFQIEPVRRGGFARSTTEANDSTFTGEAGHGYVNSVVSKERGGHTNRYEGQDYDPSDTQTRTLASSSAAFINQGQYSGSLSFPFEMSPRRIARSQRYMLTCHTGTQLRTAATTNGVRGSRAAVQPNMYIANPRQVRQLLFRVGQGHHDALFSLWGSYSDNKKVRAPNSNASNTHGRGGFHKYFMADAMSNLGNVSGGPGSPLRIADDDYIGILRVNAVGHTTGTVCKFRKSSKHHGGATGFRYGLINTEPMNTTAVFRHDKFGQYRDMLEQRPYSRFFVRIPTTRRRRGLFRIRRRRRSNNIVTRGPVYIRFVSTLTDRRIKPIRTYSQNLSSRATSSLPYFDEDREGKFRNRPFPFDESILDSHIVVEDDV